MASVTGMTAEAIDTLMDTMIVSADVDGSGQIIFTTRGGIDINAGPIIPPDAAMEKAWPVGSVYMATVNTDPATLIGIGTWVRWGQGRVPVSLDSADPTFDAVEETGGEKTHAITVAELASHAHGMAHTHGLTASFNREADAVGGGGNYRVNGWEFGSGLDNDRSGTTGGSSTANTGASGSGTPHNNLQPYIVCYMWKRTA